jgi:hypothetical protein
MTLYYVDARNATVNHVEGDQLNILRTDVNRELVNLLANPIVS